MANSYRLDAESMTIIPLPYREDSESYFNAIRHLPYAVWLDSGYGHAFEDGRYDILCGQPTTLLTTLGDLTTIKTGDVVTQSTENPFDLVAKAVANLPNIANASLPFTGGALGYFGYHLNRLIERLPPAPNRDIGLPDMQVGIYEWAVVQDHHQASACLLCLPTVASSKRSELVALVTPTPTYRTDTNRLNISKLQNDCKQSSYYEKVAAIKRYIQAGDVYQVNLAQRFSCRYQGDPYHAYSHLRKLLPAPYSAFITTEHGAVISHSPELFLAVDSDKVVTKPIKGTRPRGNNPSEDRALAEALRSSAKDQAENLMIVDLLRNDLGRHCLPGSIQVPHLYDTQTFANVHHLVSTVTGNLKPTSSPANLLRDSFPGGSITGAPKIRAMEIISELEQQERSAYCGAIGYLSTNGKLCTNIAIRTLVANQDQIFAWGGGGIVADSEAAAEYQESLDKIGVLLDGLRQQSD